GMPPGAGFSGGGPGFTFGGSMPALLPPYGPAGTGIGGLGPAAGSGGRLQFAPMYFNPHLAAGYGASHQDALIRYQKAMMRPEVLKALKDLTSGEDLGWMAHGFSKEIASLRPQADDDLLYHKPSFTNDYRFLNDLTQHAPGLNTTFADIHSVLEAESNV